MGVKLMRRKTYVGLDLGHHTIKAVQIEKTAGGWRVARLGCIATPADSIKESVVIDPESVASSIRQLLKDSHIGANSAFVAVAGGAVVVRNVRIPKMPEATLRKSIRFEASRYVPSSVEDSFIEFEIIGDAEDGQMDVLIVAAPKELIDSRVKACALAGLRVEAVDVEPFAAYRCLLEADPNNAWSHKTVAMVDVGAGMTSLSVVKEGMFVMTRTIPNGSRQLTDALKNFFQLSDEDAESGKSQLDVTDLLNELPKENPPLRIIQPHVDDLVREIRRSLNYFQSQQGEGNKAVDGLVISGGGAQLSGLTEYIAKKLGMETASAGVFDNPRFTYAGVEDAGRGLNLSVASGLAMRAFGKAA